MTDGARKIGKYDIVAELGRGAMGVVYKGLDPVINRYVAIKTVTRVGADADDAELAKRFKQEAVAAGRLNHPGIVAVYEYGEDDEQAFIAMEFVEGKTLSELAKYNQTLDLQEIWALMVKVLDSLDYAHSKGIVHRDIKPSNIMRTNDGEVKIADFGIARIESSELTMVGTVIGTPGYMSPEQLLGQQVDHRADIFSCGILLYELLTSERAFASTNITSTIYKVVHTSLPPVSKICPTVTGAIDAVLNKAMAKSPADRYQSAAEFARDIERVARGEPSLASREAPPVQAEATPPAEEERTIIRSAPAPDSDATVVVARDTVSVDPLDGFATQDKPAEAMDNKPAPGRADRGKPEPRSGSGKTWIWISAAVLALGGIGGVVMLLPTGSDTDQAEVAPASPATSTPAEPAQASDEPAAQRDITPVSSTPGSTFKECDVCPSMVVVPSGSFTVGSPAGEAEREASEGPQHEVRIDYALAVGESAVTRGQFAQFIADSGHASSGCWLYNGEWQFRDTGSWQSPGYFQADDHPVTCVSWQDAEAYASWLSSKTGARYRLLSSDEWEYAARAGTDTARHEGDAADAACAVANVADESAAAVYANWQVHACDDGYVHTAPIQSFQPNGFGVYDTLGNSFEWVADCWNDSYQGAPADGSAWMQGDCTQAVLRGGSWYSMTPYTRFAFRNHFARDHRSATFGFRVAREL